MISIIVPVYKVENYIRQCVDSIINQTYKNIEIILVDDGSPDNCPKICDDYAKSDSRVKVIHKKNGGLMSARQAGLRIANGDYVGFVDGDDWIETDMYEHLAKSINQYKPDIVLCEFLYSYPDKDEKSSQNLPKPFFTKEEAEEQIYPTMLFKSPYYSFGVNPCCWTKVMKKELLEKKLFNVTPKIKIGEDAAFTYPCMLEAQTIAYVDKFLYHYRVNPESMTKAYDSSYEETILLPYEILGNEFKNYDYNLSQQMNYYLISLVNGVIRNEANPQNNKSKKEKKQTLKKFADNKAVINAVKSIDHSLLPFHTKLMVKALSMKSTQLLYWYTILLRRFL